MPARIRKSSTQDLILLQQVEIRAGDVFRGIGMAYVADMPGIPLEQFSEAHERGHLWVAAVDGHIVGFALAEVRDDLAHLTELSVVPEHAGRGIGKRLIAEVAEWAREDSLPWLTLTTFRDVPWNAPFYVRLGFEACNPEELGPYHVTAATNGKRLFPDHPRIVMRKKIE